MKVAYFDCFSGISGDMVLGALVDAGLCLQVFDTLIDDLKLANCKVTAKKVKRAGIAATKLDVIFPSSKKISPVEMLNFIENLNIPVHLQTKAKDILLALVKAEIKIHQESLETLHFHELGSIDTLIDVLGTVVGLSALGVERIYTSKVNVGGGMVKTEHGNFPVPAPATAELLRDFPVYSTGIEAELTTPTGAAILKGLSAESGAIPNMKLEKIGYGAGEKDLYSPNVLRLFIGEINAYAQEDWVSVLETNIDDMAPQMYEHLMNYLLEKGALDVFLTPVQMKKNRPGTLLSIVCTEAHEDALLTIIFRETTTLGIRISRTRRKKLKRELKTFTSSLGEVSVKIGILDQDVVSVNPEYDDCKRIARQKNIPLKRVYEIVKSEIPATFYDLRS